MTKEEFNDLRVGRIFKLGCRKFKVMKADNENGCLNCFFDGGYGACIGMQIKNFIPWCSKYNRKDSKDVIFVEVEE